jgi:lysophospholipase L1-like esterase
MRALILAFACAGAFAQQPLLPAKELAALSGRMIQLMESVSLVVPDLPRAALPLLEQMKTAKEALDRAPQDSVATYDFLERSRKFLAIAEAMPRPYPFPEVGQRQFAELREANSRLDVHVRALLAAREAALRPADRDRVGRYAEANAQLPAPSPDAPRVVFLGDSITDGWPLNEYFPGKDYVNRGIGGQVTSEMLARMRPDVINLKPRVVVLLAGTNDIARGTALKIIQDNIVSICDLADFHKIKVVLSSILPTHDYNTNVNPQFERSKQRPPDTIRNMNGWLKSVAANRGYVFLDYYYSVVDSAGSLRKDFADDGLHPNPAGYRAMAPLLERAVGDALAAAAPQRPR